MRLSRAWRALSRQNEYGFRASRGWSTGAIVKMGEVRTGTQIGVTQMNAWLAVRGTNETTGAEPHATDSYREGLQVHCFGHFEVIRDGHTVHDWRRDKAKALLKQLLAHHGFIKRDVLMDLLWPDLDAEQAVRNLRVTLHALRRAIESVSVGDATPYVLTRGDTYEFNPSARARVDTQVFATLYEEAAGMWRRGRIEESLSTCAAAQAMYREEYLIDDLYEEWTFVPREELKNQYLLALTRLADAALMLNDHESCIGYCHKILARGTSREDAYQLLMRCHSQMGRPGRALRWFELCRETLRRDLNVSPKSPFSSHNTLRREGVPTKRSSSRFRLRSLSHKTQLCDLRKLASDSDSTAGVPLKCAVQ
jgi:DNA-binding SARP family transcriptional activator